MSSETALFLSISIVDSIVAVEVFTILGKDFWENKMPLKAVDIVITVKENQ